jgi:hypothetical protein
MAAPSAQSSALLCAAASQWRRAALASPAFKALRAAVRRALSVQALAGRLFQIARAAWNPRGLQGVGQGSRLLVSPRRSAAW